jgi:hypothetical protein
MIWDIEDEEDYMRQQFEDEEEMETFRRLEEKKYLGDYYIEVGKKKKK